MNVKLVDVASYSLAVKSLFDANKTAVVAYDPDFVDPFEANWVLQISGVSEMLGTRVLISLNKGETVVRNGYMDSLRPMLKNLEYKIKVCRTAGSITDSVASFGLTALRESITEHDINSFNTAFESTISRVMLAGNKAALIAKGFLLVNMNAMVTQHDLAWEMNTTKIDISTEVHSLSVGNQALVKALLETDQSVIDAMQAYAQSVGNADLIKKATGVAILKTIVPTKVVGPHGRKIGENQSICWLMNTANRDKLEFTLMTESGAASVCRMNSKTGVCSGGIPLVFDVKLTTKKLLIPGTGDCIIITNTGTGYCKVVVNRIKGG